MRQSPDDSHTLSYALVVGASGGIGEALVEQLLKSPKVQQVICTARKIQGRTTSKRQRWIEMDIEDETSVARASQQLEPNLELSLICVASGVLHGQGFAPERAWSQIDGTAMARVLAINTIGPALVAKHFLPFLDRRHRSVFCALAARIGSISDNRAGGWYSYRASKAALVMLIKTLSIELARKNPRAIALSLHPGTVVSDLSAPFLRSGKRPAFNPTDAANMLLRVIECSEPEDSGLQFAYDGTRIEA